MDVAGAAGKGVDTKPRKNSSQLVGRVEDDSESLSDGDATLVSESGSGL